MADLVVPVSWRVGDVTFRPPGWLQRLVRDGEAPAPLPDWQAEHLVKVEHSTAEVTGPAPRPQQWGLADERMQGRVADALAVLRLWNRTCNPTANGAWESFGLPGDYHSVVSNRWVTRRDGRIVRFGVSRDGVLGGPTLTRAHYRAYRGDARFRYLEHALTESNPDEAHRRAILAVRIFDQATLEARPQVRIVLLATALEALLGDQGKHDAFHRVAQRVAYLTCGHPESPHGPEGRPACPFLVASGTEKMRADLRKRSAAGERWECTWYWDVRRVFDDRNDALHRARLDFTDRDASRDWGTTADALLATLTWLVETGARDVDALDAEIAPLVQAAP